MKITESDIKKMVKKALQESVFGFDGKTIEGMGLKNPINNYQIDYQDVVTRASQFKESIMNFSNFIDGIEEDEENGITGTRGLASNLSMRAMWRDDDDFEKEDEEYFSQELREISSNLYRIKCTLDDLISYCENK